MFNSARHGVLEVQVLPDTYQKSTFALPEPPGIALARVDPTGTVQGINALGNAVWGWKTGDQLPSSTRTLLTKNARSIPARVADGQSIVNTSVQQQDGWLLIGHIEKTTNSHAEKSSIKTLIENTPTLHYSFAEHSPQGILFLDRSGKVLYTNRRFKSFFQLDGDSTPVETPLHDLGFDASLNLKIQYLLQEKIPSIQSTISLQEDSNDRELEVHGTPVFDESNSLIGAILSFELRFKPESTDNEELTELQSSPRLTQLKNLFVTMMSHEIRTPLGVMNGYAEILSDELSEYESNTGHELPPQIKEFVSAIHENTQRILGLVNELFDLSNMRHLTLFPVDLHEAILSVVSRTRQQLSAKGVAFNLQLAPEDLIVLSNPNRLVQVLHNILSNAVKFTHHGSVSLRTYRSASEAVIEISDTGVGISKEYLDKLFTPFLQEDMGLERKFEGAGLGLAIVKLLLDLMKGRIEVDSEKGSGSTFRIFLPTT